MDELLNGEERRRQEKEDAARYMTGAKGTLGEVSGSITNWGNAMNSMAPLPQMTAYQQAQILHELELKKLQHQQQQIASAIGADQAKKKGLWPW